MEVLRLEHVYLIVGGVLAALGVYGLILWLSTKPARVVNLLAALKSRFVIDYDELADAVPYPDFTPQDDPSVALDGTPSQTRTTRADDEAWTDEDILRQLATIKRIDKSGTPVYLSKEKMAALMNMRAEEARVIINEARGEPPPDALRVKDSSGERLIARV